MKCHDSEFDRSTLNNVMSLAKLDGRSKASYRFGYKIETDDYNTFMEFIDWGSKNLGQFSMYDMYYGGEDRQHVNLKNVNWLINTKPKSLGGAYGEFYVKKEDLTLIALNWRR